MRYKHFLVQEKAILGSGRSVDITEDAALALLNKHCSDAVKAYKKGSRIQRGVRNDAEYLSVDPKSGKPRKSANTKNYYTILMDNMKSWGQYPKRSESLICSTGNVSFGYGYMFVVFPYNGAKIGVAPERDLWLSFRKSLNGKNLDQINNNISTIMRHMNVQISDKSYLDILNAFGTFDMFIKDKPQKLNVLIDGGIEWLEGYKGDLLKHVRKALDPNYNEFELKSIGDALPKDREVWTDSKCVMISTKKIDLMGI